jgi:hypothetical protein
MAFCLDIAENDLVDVSRIVIHHNNARARELLVQG